MMQRAQNGVSMKMKANTYTRKKQIVEEKLIENYAKYYKLAYSYVRNESDAQDIDLYHAIDALETLDRTILTLRYFEELKLEQIAQITQQNLNTVKTRLYRTLKKLRLTFLSNEDI